MSTSADFQSSGYKQKKLITVFYQKSFENWLEKTKQTQLWSRMIIQESQLPLKKKQDSSFCFFTEKHENMTHEISKNRRQM